jgi:hypothetical protein
MTKLKVSELGFFQETIQFMWLKREVHSLVQRFIKYFIIGIKMKS